MPAIQLLPAIQLARYLAIQLLRLSFSSHLIMLVEVVRVGDDDDDEEEEEEEEEEL